MTGRFGDTTLLEHLRARAAERLAAELAAGFVRREPQEGDEPPFYDSGYVAHVEDYPTPTWKARP